MSKYLITIFLSYCISLNLYANCKEVREDTVCGSIQEPFLFWLWSSLASSPDSSRVANIKFIEPSEFKTSDYKTLRGYKYISNNGHITTHPKGYILVAMGNAMVSDKMIIELKSFSEKNYDIYVYDYRGYANSDGKRRINAIINDYKEIATTLNKSYERKLLYGISLGGAVIMNVIGSGIEYDAAVIDSSPSLLSTNGCPKRIDPLVNLPEDASKILVITGKKDIVLGENMTSELRDSAHKRGAKTINDKNYAHPFNDRKKEIHNQRMELILNHLNSYKNLNAKQ